MQVFSQFFNIIWNLEDLNWVVILSNETRILFCALAERAGGYIYGLNASNLLLTIRNLFHNYMQSISEHEISPRKSFRFFEPKLDYKNRRYKGGSVVVIML